MVLKIWPTSDANRFVNLRPDSEVYNEKIYDLLESPLPSAPPSTPAAPSHSHGGSGMFKGLFKNFTTVKRSALSLKADKTATASTPGQSAPKVIGGLKEVRVANAEVSREDRDTVSFWAVLNMC